MKLSRLELSSKKNSMEGFFWVCAAKLMQE